MMSLNISCLRALCCRFTLEVWNKLAELTSQQLDKGMQIQARAQHPLTLHNTTIIAGVSVAVVPLYW